MRTLARLIDFELDAETAEDSFDISATLFTKASDLNSSPIRDHLIHHSGNGLFAIREGAWKLILGKNSGGFTRFNPPADAPAGQLYNLRNDPSESNNLYEQNPKVVQQLTQRLNHLKNSGRSFDQ